MKKLQPFDMSSEHTSLLYFWQTIDKRQHPVVKWLYSPQIEYLRDEQKAISPRIQHLLRFETLTEDWPAFALLHDLPPLPHKNKSEGRTSPNWQEELSAESIAKIGELYADDFEHLNYERLI